jgi:hypothetical protein
MTQQNSHTQIPPEIEACIDGMVDRMIDRLDDNCMIGDLCPDDIKDECTYDSVRMDSYGTASVRAVSPTKEMCRECWKASEKKKYVNSRPQGVSFTRNTVIA